MTDSALPAALETAFSYSNPEAVFAALLPAVCDVLQSDRCFLHLRNPHSRVYRNLCWRTRADLPDVSTAGWEPEKEWEKEDPMFAAALRTDASIFVNDVETASPDVLNVEFERQNFGHRALIHAHMPHDGMLWGILQPCIFGHPRQWSDADRAMVNQILARLTPVVVDYVKSAGI